MTSRTRLFVLAITTPVIAFAIVGGYLGQAAPRDTTYRQLAVFEDVLELVLNNYVEEVDVRKAMAGAMRGLADGLDADSAFLTPDLVKVLEANDPGGPAEIGVDVVRQYYLRIVAARDGSPAANAGLRSGDYIRAIDGRPTRDMSAVEGARLLRGQPGSAVRLLVIRGNAAEPHELTVVRARLSQPDVTSRMADASTGYVRIAEFTRDTAQHLKTAFDTLAQGGASAFVIDLRGTARGAFEDAIAAARLFVPSGTLAIRQSKGQQDTIAARPGDGAITAPVTLLINLGTSGAAEVFAAALDDNQRAELVGMRTLGRAARQELVKLSNGSGLLLTRTRYLTPGRTPIHQKGLQPDVDVEEPVVEFGMEPPAGDPVLEKALERLSTRQAA